MEQARLLLAIGLSFLVLFVWSTFFVDTQPPIDQTATVSSEKPTADIPVVAAPDPDLQAAADTNAPTISEASLPGQIPPRDIRIETPYYSATLSSKGAVFTSYILKHYKEASTPDSANKQLIPPDFRDGVIRTSLSNNSLRGLPEALYSIDRPEDRITVSDETQSISFLWENDEGAVITKTYRFNPTSYLIDLTIALTNGSTQTLKDALVLSVRKDIREDSGYAFVGPSALIDNALEQIKIKKIEDKSEYSGDITWASVEDRYFLSSIIPETAVKGKIKLLTEEDVVVNQLVNPTFELAPGSQKTYQYHIFMGPKSMALLDSLGYDMGKALNFGFFNFIAKPCLWFMNQIHQVIPNYGVAIILLTIFTKILLWPLGNKSYKSMSEMKKLQPLMTDIREKYKNDKQKMNQELMALYRTYKVNPMGGCLPMVLQIPVFFALYRMLYQAIELRHAPFILWINDLSAPDRLFNFGFSIPFMEPPYGIPILTIIMGASMILQQKMSPPPGDPTQAKMMMLMPVVFTFIFINFSSGLVLYWLVNNLLSISQQYYVQKKTI